MSICTSPHQFVLKQFPNPNMFRKRPKVLGSVTIFEDDNIDAVDRFNDLVLDNDGGTGDHIDNMTSQQISELAIANAQTGKEGTKRALQIVTETCEIGDNTAETLHGQTAQLERLGDEFEVVNDYLDKSERKLFRFLFLLRY